MKIQLLWVYDHRYLHSFYERYPEAAGAGYTRQLDLLLDDFLIWQTTFVHYWRQAGHDVSIIVGNCRSMQEAWALENDYPFDRQNWQNSVVREQVRRFRPDILWLAPALRYFDPFLSELKTYCGRALVWIACSLPPGTALSSFDGVITSHPDLVLPMQRRGEPQIVRLLPSFDTRLAEHLAARAPDIPVSFIGAFSRDHTRRWHILNYLVQQTPLQVWSYNLDRWKWQRRPMPLRTFFAQFKWFMDRQRILRRYQGETWGRDMYDLLRRSMMTVNVHNDIAGCSAGNMRILESTGTGTLLLTEKHHNLPEILEPDREVVTYVDEYDLARKIEYFLRHDTEREAIALAGQERTLRDHNSQVRAQQLMQIFGQLST